MINQRQAIMKHHVNAIGRAVVRQSHVVPSSMQGTILGDASMPKV